MTVYAPGHVGIALALFAPVALRLHRREETGLAVVGTATVAVVTLLPDVDLYLPWVVHRGPTHTVWFAILVGVSLGTVGGLIGARRIGNARGALGLGAYGAGIGALAVLAHLAGDVITPMGIRPLAPVWDASFTLDLVYSRNLVANAAFLAVGSVASLGQLSAGTETPPTALVRSVLDGAASVVTGAVYSAGRGTARERPHSHRPSSGTAEAVHRAYETDD